MLTFQLFYSRLVFFSSLFSNEWMYVKYLGLNTEKSTWFANLFIERVIKQWFADSFHSRSRLFWKKCRITFELPNIKKLISNLRCFTINRFRRSARSPNSNWCNFSHFDEMIFKRLISITARNDLTDFFGVPGSSGLGEVPVPQQQLQQPRRGIQTSPSGLVTNIPT